MQIFQFLKDIATKDINNAISLQGGVQYLRNMNQSNCEELCLKVEFDLANKGIILKKKEQLFGIRFSSGGYNLVIKFKKSLEWLHNIEGGIETTWIGISIREDKGAKKNQGKKPW